MSEFYSEFSEISKEEWLEQVSKDLKGKEVADVLHHTHPIQEVKYKSYAFPEDASKHEVPGDVPYTRGGRESDNDWEIVNAIQNSSPEKMNKTVLNRLMKGATGIRFDLQNFSSKDCDQLINGVGLEFITSTFIFSTKEQYDWLIKLTKSNPSIKGAAINKGEKNFGLIPKLRNFLIEGVLVQRNGGNVSQEIAYCLHKGHEKLFELMTEENLSIDDAAAQIKFRLGIGSDFFFEIAKIKVLRKLWHQIVSAYKPEHKCSSIAYIESETSFLNKSLKDPYNNLLRQTTEALSAVLGGVEELTILPYNWKAKSSDLEKTQRLATNIALLLKEESYLDKVIDPAGGAYSQEELITVVSEKSWNLFLEMEKKGTEELEKEIKRIAKIRIERIENNDDMLIGVNKFFNPDKNEDTWQTPELNELGKELILELECNIDRS